MALPLPSPLVDIIYDYITCYGGCSECIIHPISQACKFGSKIHYGTYCECYECKACDTIHFKKMYPCRFGDECHYPLSGPCTCYYCKRCKKRHRFDNAH